MVADGQHGASGSAARRRPDAEACDPDTTPVAHPEHAYRVEARNEVFYRCGEHYFRANELWRTAPSGGDDDPGEKVRTNCALVKYVPTDVAVVDIDLGIG